MPLQCIVSREFRVTRIAFDFGFVVHLFDMLLQSRFAIEHAVTHGAVKTIFTGMVEHMGSKLSGLNEFFTAYIADVWSYLKR